MVTRSIFFICDGMLCRKDIQIEWDLGFDFAAKKEYIKRIKEQIPTSLSPAIDVTTASDDETARNLSPFYLRDMDGLSIEDAWAEFKNTAEVSPEHYSACFCYIYLSALSSEQIEYVVSQRSFFDVFFNPEKAYNTQAMALAMLQLLITQGKAELMGNVKEFVQWFEENFKQMVVI